MLASITVDRLPILMMAGCLIATIGLGWLAVRIMNQGRKEKQFRMNKELNTTASLQRLEQMIHQVDVRLAKTEDWVRPAADPVSHCSLGTTSRAKAIRLHRLGQTPDQVAETLNAPIGEVLLLLKVHELMLHRLVGEEELQEAQY